LRLRVYTRAGRPARAGGSVTGPKGKVTSMAKPPPGLGLPAVAGTSVAQGSYLNAATAREPVVVLGAEAAQLMGIDRIWPEERIWVGSMWFYLVGILNPATLAPQIDTRRVHARDGRQPRGTAGPLSPAAADRQC
jgi:hypothetical protein